MNVHTFQFNESAIRWRNISEQETNKGDVRNAQGKNKINKRTDIDNLNVSLSTDQKNNLYYTGEIPPVCVCFFPSISCFSYLYMIFFMCELYIYL